MARVPYEDEIIISWVELHRDARYLSEVLHQKGPWKGIIAVTRGGLVPAALVARGLDPDASSWDAWRNEDGRWTVQMGWKAGMSDNVAHFRYAPGAHGGTVTAFDDAACQLIDPNYARPLRPLAPVAQLALEEPEPAPAKKAPAKTAAAKKPAAKPAPKAEEPAEEADGFDDLLSGLDDD